MGKIGILTFNRPINYGAVLQAFALKTVLSSYTETDIINYYCPYIEDFYNPFNNFIKGIVRTVVFGKRNKRFKKFIAKISTQTLYDKQSIRNAEYEKIVVGSDQVWNYGCSGNDETFLLPDMDVKKYSYAGSFGVSELPENEVPFFKKHLADFRYISVREKTGQDICKNQLGLSSEIVLDPTLLLTKADWEKHFNVSPTAKKNYVLLFAFKHTDTLHTTAKKVSEQLGLPVYTILVKMTEKFGDKVISNAGPKEWVELFFNASFIITDSFHGTAFSVNFNKPFYSFAHNARSSRLTDFLGALGLQDRLNPSLENVNTEAIIDYSSVNKILEDERQKSFAFIEKIIHD